MPRQSAAAAAVIPIRPRTVAPRPRADAPADVAAIFREIVASSPAGHFQASDGALLEQYAQAILLARQAYQHLDDDGPVIEGRASPWLVVLEKSHRSAVALSGRLRLAPQSRADARAAGRKANEPPPSPYDLLGDDRG